MVFVIFLHFRASKYLAEHRVLLSVMAMAALDADGDGFISRSEFLRLADPEVISNSQSWIARL